MIRRPPRSTLFPSRRSSDLASPGRTTRPVSSETRAVAIVTPAEGPSLGMAPAGTCTWMSERSEEHTSELQSQSNLVCRLLLEKKKNTSNRLDQHQYHIPVAS